ncbi:MAG TPA: hypothetical protein VFF39_05295, partial [Verrucomicrobiae bacterium]|nr:hypothetical protein [Verrucomicrobiae bacterium]
CAVVFSTTVRAKSSDLVDHWAGCYAIYSLPAMCILPDPREAKDDRDTPIGFRLMTTQRDGSTVDLIGAFDLGLNDRWPLKGWEPKPDGSVMLYWSTGFVRYEVLLQETESRITGTVEYFTDTDPPGPSPKLAIEARRMSCEMSLRKTK